MAGSGVPLGLLLLICLHLPGMEVVPNPLHRWKLEGSRGTGIEGRGKGKRVLGENEGIWSKENPRWALEPNIHPSVASSFFSLRLLWPKHWCSGGESNPTLGSQLASAGTTLLDQPLQL